MGVINMDRYEIEEDEIDMREVVNTIIDNSTTILSIILLFLLGTMLYLYFSKPIYSSSVTIALDNQGSNKLESMLSDKLLQGNKAEGKLQLAKVTIESKKFIDTIIDKININRELFVKTNFKKSEIPN
jgi:uncharacterized protein involved in exopolysaccharide biosynthesis